MPSTECTIAGNLRDMLMHLTAAERPAGLAAMRVPACWSRRMTVAGG